MTHPVLASIQVGLPSQFGEDGAADPMDRLWTTGFYKQPVVGPVRLGVTNIEGDGQADLVHHGGPDKAVLAYAAEHYDSWRRELNIQALLFGAFGENFTVEGMTEADVCIGDIWKVGDEAKVQVSQPRQPCWKLARRWRVKTLARQVQETGRTGWYYRVLAEGVVAAGMPMVLVERPQPVWSVERANRVMHADKDDLQAAAELAAIPALSASWKTTLLRHVEQNVPPDPAKRLIGQVES
jgi:MOSC domain-containing protein YiiM